MTVNRRLPSLIRSRTSRLAVKVPEITVAFWIVKVLTTGMGETASDYLAHTIGPVPAVALAGAVFVVALAVQLGASRYRPAIYWTAVSMVSVFGTVTADVLHVGLGVPYVVSTLGFAAVLAAILVAWYRTEGTLSIHSITSSRREVYYWATVLATFALGTAVGDLTAVTLSVGYLGSGVLFAVAIAVPALLHSRFGLNPVVAFWWAYILTRPLGASFADWMGVSQQRGGLGWGIGPVTLAWALLVIAAVGWMAWSGRLRARTALPGDTAPDAAKA